MGSTLPQKRVAPKNAALSSRARRRKFRAVGVETVRRADLSQAQRGVLVSCTPGHEHHAFRDAVVLLSKFVRAEKQPSSAAPTKRDHEIDAKPTDKNALESELAQLRKGNDGVFTRVVADVKGAVFLRVEDQRADVEHVVEHALLEARESGNAGSRHCIRVIPVHGTCYAKADLAANVALTVVKEHFPSVEREGGVSFAIVFRARLNNSAKRDHFIEAIAKAIHDYEPRYKVDLTKPDVVLIVEVLKTSCCIGTFRKFYQLAKLNLREAACPSKEKEKENKMDGGDDKKEANEKAADGCDERDVKENADRDRHDARAEANEKAADGGDQRDVDEKADKDRHDVQTEADEKVADVGDERDVKKNANEKVADGGGERDVKENADRDRHDVRTEADDKVADGGEERDANENEHKDAAGEGQTKAEE